MRPRVSADNSERSLTVMIEHALTIILVLVVAAAIFQIAGFHPSWLY